MTKGSRQVSSLAAAGAAAGLALACSQPRPAPSEAPAASGAAPAVDTPAPARASELPPPRPEEIRDVVKRVFKDDASEGTGGEAVFTVGDFNGDFSQDIAIVVRPAAGRLDEMNGSPRWMLKDPFQPDQPGAAPLRVEAGEALLAVVHGEGPAGWRNPEARQTWLLKNAAGSGMTTQTGPAFMAVSMGRALPRIHGDLIAEVLRGTPGHLYYTGASYSWYDPKTFIAAPQPQIAHRTQAR